MAVSIKNEETERLARELAKRTGVSRTEAITTALREQRFSPTPTFRKSLDERRIQQKRGSCRTS